MSSRSLKINPVIYAELSMAFARIEELEAVVTDGGLEVEEIPREALFLASKVYLGYQQRSTVRDVFPDGGTHHSEAMIDAG